MKPILTATFLLIALSATSANATIQIDLPGLTGDYSIGGSEPPLAPSSRTMSFVLPDSIESIAGLKLKLSGPWTPGKEEVCRVVDGITYCDTIPCGTRLNLRLTADSIGDCFFQASVPAYGWVDGDEPMIDFCLEGEADINLLLGEEITAEFFCGHPPGSVPPIVEATYGTMNEVQLETIGAVPAKEASWGGVKSLFR